MGVKIVNNANLVSEVLETLRETYTPKVFDNVSIMSTLVNFLLPKFKQYNSTQKVYFKYQRYNTSQILSRGDAIVRDNGQETRETLEFIPTYIMKDIAFVGQDLSEIGADKTRIFDFVASRIDEAVTEFYEDLATFIYGQLDTIIDGSTSLNYGGKARASYLDNLTSLLAGTVDSTGNLTATAIEAIITAAVQKGTSRPDLIVCHRVNKLVIGKFDKSNDIQIQTPLTTVSGTLAAVANVTNYISFVNVVFENIPVLEDNFCSTQKVYVLNTKAIEGQYISNIIGVGDEASKPVTVGDTMVTPEGVAIEKVETGFQMSGLVYDKDQFGYNTTIMWAGMLYSATPRAHGMIKNIGVVIP